MAKNGGTKISISNLIRPVERLSTLISTMAPFVIEMFGTQGISKIIYLPLDRERNLTSTIFGEPPPPPLYTPLQSEVTETQTELALDTKKELLPFISFVSIDLQIYDIYFDSDGIKSQKPRLGM